MPKSSNKEIMEFKRLVREVMKKKSVSKSPLSRELEKRKKKRFDLRAFFISLLFFSKRVKNAHQATHFRTHGAQSHAP